MRIGRTQLFLLQIAQERGLTLSDIARVHNRDVTWKNKKIWYTKAEQLEKLGLLWRNSHVWRLTERGFHLINQEFRGAQ